MEQDLIKDEIGRTILRLTKKYKVSETDRYLEEWHKTFRDLITPSLLKIIHLKSERHQFVGGEQL